MTTGTDVCLQSPLLPYVIICLEVMETSAPSVIIRQLSNENKFKVLYAVLTVLPPPSSTLPRRRKRLNSCQISRLSSDGNVLKLKRSISNLYRIIWVTKLLSLQTVPGSGGSGSQVSGRTLRPGEGEDRWAYHRSRKSEGLQDFTERIHLIILTVIT